MKITPIPASDSRHSFYRPANQPDRYQPLFVRVPPEIHKAVVDAAIHSGLSVNEYVMRVLCSNALAACHAIQPFLPDDFTDSTAGSKEYLDASFQVDRALDIFANGVPSVQTNPSRSDVGTDDASNDHGRRNVGLSDSTTDLHDKPRSKTDRVRGRSKKS